MKTITVINNKVIKSKKVAKPIEIAIVNQIRKLDSRNQKQVIEKDWEYTNIQIKSGVANNLIHKFGGMKFSTDLSKFNHSVNRINYPIELIKDIEVFSFKKIKYVLVSGKATIEVKYNQDGLVYTLYGKFRIAH